jgi:branched-chain amino acid transport system ATP-binding protein
VLLCDEISLGLAPIIVEDIYRTLPLIRGNGASIVIVEQDVARALKHCDRFYCLQEGRVTLSGRPADIAPEAVRMAYFGT